MAILVTGGAGYIGSLLIRVLPRLYPGETIKILDNMFRQQHASLWNLPEGVTYEFLEADVRDVKAVRSMMKDVDTVFSLSDITNAPISFERKDLTWDVNFTGAMNVFDEAIRAEVVKYVYTSTCSVYGPTEGTVTEEAECKPASPYGQSKLKAERKMQFLAKEAGFDWTALRLGTVYGRTPALRLDTVVNRFAYLAAQATPLTVYKSAWKEKRPYLYVRDAMEAYVLAAMSHKARGEVFNAVSQNANMDMVIKAIHEAAHWLLMPPVTVKTVEKPMLNQLSYETDASKIRGYLGFSPKGQLVDGIEEIMRAFRGVSPIVKAWSTVDEDGIEV